MSLSNSVTSNWNAVRTPTLGSDDSPATVNSSVTLYPTPSSVKSNWPILPLTLTRRLTTAFVPIPVPPETYSRSLLKYGSGSVTSKNIGLSILPPLLKLAYSVVKPRLTLTLPPSILSKTSNPAYPTPVEEVILLPWNIWPPLL